MFDHMRRLLRAAPFEPFRIYLNDGRYLDVHHPEFCGLSRSTVYVSLPTDVEEPDHVAHIQMRNVTSVEHLFKAEHEPL